MRDQLAHVSDYLAVNLDVFGEDYPRQAMAMMLLFPNMIQFDKQSYSFEHYLVGSN